MRRPWLLVAVTASLVAALAGCGSQQGSQAAGQPTGTASAGPKASPTPTAILEGLPSAISGNYTLYRRLVSCVHSDSCALNPMKIRIACSGGTCTIIRTNNGLGFPPWDHAIPIVFEEGAWKATGNERNAYQCHHRPVPSGNVTFTLKVVSGAVVNGVWRTRQLAGTYGVATGPTSCNNNTSSSAVETVASAPALTMGQWPGTTGPAAASTYYGYPFPDASACTDGGSCNADYWRFFQGQCTSWVAYRLHELNGVTIQGGASSWSGADHWAQYARDHGISVDTVPAVGSVAWWPNSKNHIGGHVAYVEKVNSPTSIVISEMNYDNDNGFRVRPITTASGDWPADFIHIADM